MEAAESEPGAYFGKDLKAAPRAWSRAEIEQNFNPACVDAAFDTVEVAINPVEPGKKLRAYIIGHPGIETALNSIVTKAKIEDDAVWVETEHKNEIRRKRFDHVVNALWGGRLALNHSVGLYSNRPWLHRLKYEVSLRLPPSAQMQLSSTFVLGPFGEVVSYGDGTIYLTWYPECVQGISRELLPPNWANYPDEPLRSQIIHRTVEALSGVVPSLRQIDPKDLLDAQVKGGLSWRGAIPTSMIPKANSISAMRSASSRPAGSIRWIRGTSLWRHILPTSWPRKCMVQPKREGLNSVRHDQTDHCWAAGLSRC